MMNKTNRTNRTKFALCFVLYALCFTPYAVTPAHAQNFSSAVAVDLPVTGDVVDGSIICAIDNAYKACEQAYDSTVLGVVNLTPAVAFQKDINADKYKSVVNSGKAYVLVSTVNGAVKSGDYITTSNTKGIGQKFTRSGYVLGVALQDFEEADKTKTAKILVSIDIKPAVLSKGAHANLILLIKEGVDAYFLTPLAALRYFVAAVMVIGTAIFGIFNFGKVARSGVEAMARNPLAAQKIQLSIIFNVIMALLTMALGVAIAYVVLIV